MHIVGKMLKKTHKLYSKNFDYLHLFALKSSILIPVLESFKKVAGLQQVSGPPTKVQPYKQMHLNFLFDGRIGRWLV